MHYKLYKDIQMGMFKNTKHKEIEVDKPFPFIVSHTHTCLLLIKMQLMISFVHFIHYV